MSSEHDEAGQRGSALRFDASNAVTASATDVGRVRSVNQDAYGEFESRGLRLLIVADGMGGHRAGEVASEIAIGAAGEVFEASTEPADEVLRSALVTANTRIFDAACEDPSLAGMGTTGVALVLTGESRCFVAHVGDSRAYRLRGDELEQLTDDHSVVGELVKRGQLTPEQARVHPQSNEILRALGTQANVDVELTPIEVEPGDRLLLCSDGLSGMLPDPKIAEILSRRAPGEAVSTLVDLANEAGGTDNITVQIAEIPSGPASGAKAAGDAASTGAPSPVLLWAGLAIALFVILVVLLSGND
jgi:protein phosphatase